MATLAAFLLPSHGYGQGAPATPERRSVYRLPFVNGTTVKIFDDFATHRPRGRVDIYAIHGTKPYRVVAAAAGRVVAIQDRYSEQQSGRPAALCHNNYVWIAHPNGEWTNYSHLAHGSVTNKAHLRVGEEVAAGQYIGDEGAVGCAMLRHVHFEVAVPDPAHPIDSGGFLTDNDDGKRELNPRFCGVPGWNAIKGKVYVAASCMPAKQSKHQSAGPASQSASSGTSEESLGAVRRRP
jgi:murein DD-endopeptidase MepM/ murein hydrolase activator NlpD